jgi:hypothetical protein
VSSGTKLTGRAQSRLEGDPAFLFHTVQRG